jgi:hypothetical protein
MMTFLKEKHKINGVIIMMEAMIARDFKFERVIGGAGRTFLVLNSFYHAARQPILFRDFIGSMFVL